MTIAALGTGLLSGVALGLGPANAAVTAPTEQAQADRQAGQSQSESHRTFTIRAADGPAGSRLTSTLSELDIEWEQQINGYYCGPASTRMALKANQDMPPDQDELAGMLGTTEAGTDHIGLVTDVMNEVLGSDYYTSTMVDYTATAEQKEQFRQDVQTAVDDGYGVVANIWVVDGGPRPEGIPPVTSFTTCP